GRAMALHDTLLMSASDMESLAALPNASLRAGTATMLRALASLRQAALLGPQAVLGTAAPILATLGGCPQAAFIVPSRSSWRVVLSNAERIHAIEEVVAELSALENVATEILSVREVDQVLLSITRKAVTLLEADMSGVFLIEGENLVMRSLMGHRSVETSRLR